MSSALKFMDSMPIREYLREVLVKKIVLEKELKKLGFTFLREGGSHEVWSNGTKSVTIPRHREINEYTAKAIIKQAKEG